MHQTWFVVQALESLASLRQWDPVFSKQAPRTRGEVAARVEDLTGLAAGDDPVEHLRELDLRHLAFSHGPRNFGRC